MNRMAARRRAEPEFDPTAFYPSGDGEPIADTGIHVMAIMLLFQALEDVFRNRPDTFLAANMFWYWERGNPKARRSPDVMVVPGIGRAHRDSYMSWLEDDTPPDIVFEITSRATWREDLGPKLKDYEPGVGEYFVFDPIDRCLKRRLQGFRLTGRKYRPIRRSADGSLGSRHGFRIRVEGAYLRLIDEATGNPVLTRAELVEVAERAAEDAFAQSEASYSQAVEEHHRAEMERARADEEQQRADRLQADLDRLRRQVGEHKRNGT